MGQRVPVDEHEVRPLGQRLEPVQELLLGVEERLLLQLQEVALEGARRALGRVVPARDFEPGDLDDRVAVRRPVGEQPSAPSQDDDALPGGGEHQRPRVVVSGDRDDRRAEPRDSRDDPGLVGRAALGQVADEEDRLSGREALERGQHEAIRVEVGRDHDRLVDGGSVLRALSGDGDQPREPLDCVAVGVVVAPAGGQHALRELEQPRQLLAVGVEGRLAQGAVVEPADARPDEDDGRKRGREPGGRPEQEPATAVEDGDDRSAEEAADCAAEEREQSRSPEAVRDRIVQLALEPREARVGAPARAQRGESRVAVEGAKLELHRDRRRVRLGPDAPVDDRDVDVHLPAPCRDDVDRRPCPA